MAKRFAGFTPDQLGKIVPEMSGMQADEQKKFLASNPAAAARVGMMTEKAQMALNKGGYIQGFRAGGFTGLEQALPLKAAASLFKDQLQPTIGSNQFSADTAQDTVQAANPFANLMQQRIPEQNAQLFQDMPSYSTQGMLQQVDNKFQNSQVVQNAQLAQANLENQVAQELGFARPTNQEQADQYNTRMQQLVSDSPEIQAASQAQQELNASQQNYSSAMGTLQAAKDAQAADPSNADLIKAVTDAEAAFTLAGE
jgi:hypothetical protein